MTTFERTINGVNYDIVCKSWETRYSWGHECRIYKGYKQLTSARCRYYNRTWESFQYQSVAISAIWNVLAEVKQNLKEAYKELHGYKLLTASRKEAFNAWIKDQEEYKEVHELLESFRD